MNADGVEVLHAAYSNRRIVGVTHDFEFDFLEPFYALLHKNLSHGGKFESVFHNLAKFGFVFCKTAARAAQSECGTEHHGIADNLCGFDCFFRAVRYLRRYNGFADTLAHLFELFSVFRHFDTFKRRSEQFNVAFVQNTAFCKFHCKVETGLSAECGDYGIGAFVTYDFGDVFEGERLHINLVRHHLVRHYRCGIGVCKYDFVALFFECDTSLRARIVELRRLPYYYRAGTYDKYFLYILSFRHFSSTPRCSR